MKEEIVFAKTRYFYDSYRDFWKLVELSEYPVVYVDEIDHRAKNTTYIACPFNGEFHGLGNHKEGRKSKILLWNLERPSASGGVEDYKKHLQEHISNGYIDQVIVSDTTLADQTGFTYVPVGSHEGLGEPGGMKSFAYVHLMCYSNRRGFLFDGDPNKPKLSYAGTPIAPNGWGEERHQSLQKSWMMLNIHQDDDRYLEPLRFALAAAYALPILSENLYADPFPYQNGTIQFPMDQVGYAMTKAFGMRKHQAHIGMQMRDFVLMYHTFRGCIERFLK